MCFKTYFCRFDVAGFRSVHIKKHVTKKIGNCVTNSFDFLLHKVLWDNYLARYGSLNQVFRNFSLVLELECNIETSFSILYPSHFIHLYINAHLCWMWYSRGMDIRVSELLVDYENREV